MIACPCGAMHPSADGLSVVGWQNLEAGEVALLVNCSTCARTICAEYHTDAGLCAECRRFIRGTIADPKSYDHASSRVLCGDCAARETVAMPHPAFSAWVRTGDPEALFRWREAVLFHTA